MTTWIDITTAASCPPPATGIPRVEMNLAERLCAMGARACLYEARLGRFSEVRAEDVQRLARRAASTDALEFDLHRHDRSANGGLGLFDRGDAIVTCGFNWRPHFGNMTHLYALRSAIGLRVVTMCHDLIPLKFPHFVPGMEREYAPYLTAMVRHADHVLCNSRCTQRDLLAWSRGIVDRAPATSVMPLGCEVRIDGAGIVDALVADVLAQRFLLSVGTIERRKNHRVLVAAYALLVARGVVDLPRLVLVGQLGEGGSELVDAIDTDAAIRDRVVILSGVSDHGLARLYACCRFTLYPSLYEGWGLPVSESLAHGKFCLASDRGSLPEAGGPFVDCLDPQDVDRWADAIARYLRDAEALHRRESDIRRQFVPTPWRASATHVLAIVAGLA